MTDAATAPRSRSVLLWASIAVPAALLLACAWFSAEELHETRAAASGVAHSRDGLDQLGRLRTALFDAAQNFRFVEPQDTSRSDPAHAMDQVRRILGHLQPAESDSPGMATQLTRLREAVGACLAMLDYRRIAFLARDDAALAELLARESQTLEPALLAIEDIETSQRWVAEQRAQEMERRNDELRGALGITTAVAVVLQLWIWMVIRIDRRRRARVELSLRASNEELESRVSERTATLAAANRTLAALSSRLLQVQEQERRALALELHDQIGQQLAALLLNLRVMETYATRKGDGEDAARVHDCTDIVQTTYEQIHDLALDLRPSLLDRAGLVPTIEWYARHQQTRTSCRITVSADALPHPLAPEIATAAFRIAQEAVNNALKHGEAKSIDIALRRGGTFFALSIKDDGKGFEVSAAPDWGGCGLGLLGMRERASLAGGNLVITSHAGAGTEVRATLPIIERKTRAEVEGS